MTNDAIKALLAELDANRPWHGIATPDSGLPPSAWSQATLLAATLWAEARGEGQLGMLMVGCVIRNRVKLAPRFGVDWRGVLLRPKQFSCWNAGDASGIRACYPLRHDAAAWEIAARCAYDVYHERCPDLVDGADHYHATHVQPAWAALMTRTAEYGRHVFLRSGGA